MSKAGHYGITGVPSFVAGGRVLVGAHPYDMLAQQLVEAGAEPKSADKKP